MVHILALRHEPSHRFARADPTSRQRNHGYFVEGHGKDDVRQMLFGLSVLSSSTEAQLKEAMRFVQARGRKTVEEIEAILSG